MYIYFFHRAFSVTSIEAFGATEKVSCYHLQQAFHLHCMLYFLRFQRNPDILNDMLTRLDAYNQTAVPAANLPLDPNADPRFFDNTWTNFGDFTVDI